MMVMSNGVIEELRQILIRTNGGNSQYAINYAWFPGTWMNDLYTSYK